MARRGERERERLRQASEKTEQWRIVAWASGMEKEAHPECHKWRGWCSATRPTVEERICDAQIQLRLKAQEERKQDSGQGHVALGLAFLTHLSRASGRS